MSELNPIFAVVIHCSLFLSGLLGNTFILTVHLVDWWKTRELNSCDVIINCIVISNIALQGTVLTNEVCFFMFVTFYFQDTVVNVLASVMSSLAFCSLWCSTCLCFYYCVKIVNFSGTCFYKLQAKLPVIVPILLALSIVLSWTAGLPAYWDLYLYMAFTNDTFSGNHTHTTYYNIKSRCNCLFQVYMLLSSIAFTIVFNTAGTLIFSLCRHMKRLKKNKEGFSNAKVNTHLSAARTVTFLLTLYLVFYGVLNAIFNETAEIGSLMFSLCFIIISTFPTINSIILITGNRKLANAIKRLLGLKSGTDCAETNTTNT
ncbi:taste receptor type 2 member 39-like [Mantella aurantiaca]